MVFQNWFYTSLTSAYHTTIPYRIQTSHKDQFYAITILGIILILIFLLTNILWNTSQAVFANIIFFYSFSYLLFLTKIYKKQATTSILSWHANLAQNDFQIAKDGTAQVTVNSSGQVGIGSTQPSSTFFVDVSSLVNASISCLLS